MPTFDIVKENTAEKTFRVSSIMGMFDLKSEHVREQFSGAIDIENRQWNVGVIYGASGTGKSTIARQLFADNYVKNFEYHSQSIIDDMPKDRTVKEITQVFNSVGFSSPMSWIKPYEVLSNGEKMRVDLARAILEDKQIICFDEYTSVINREVAKVGSFALQKAVRKANKKFVAVSCHSDIIDWLEPDWVFCTDNMSFFLPIIDRNDQLSSAKYINARENYGSFSGSIII